MKAKLLVITLFALVFHQKINAQIVYYTQNFSSGTQPAGWLNDSLGFPSSHVWVFNNPFSRVITGAGFDANFAIFDSDEGTTNDGVSENASLTTDVINLSAASGQLYLLLDQQYNPLGGPSSQGSAYRIEMSINNGTNWSTLAYDSLGLGYPTAILTSYDISPAAGSATVKFKFTYTGNYDWWWAIDNIKIQNQTDPCAGVTLGGVITADSLVICDGGTVNLTLTPNISATTLPVQWYSSSNGINYSPIVGATGLTYNQSITSPTFFSATISCGANTDTIVPVEININPIPTCYCYPINPICNSSDYIIAVSLNTLVSMNSCDTSNSSSGYTFHPASMATTALDMGLPYTLTVITNNNNIISVWIDYNHNHIYEANEWQQVAISSLANVANTISITVPGSALPGLTGMRIRSRSTGSPNAAPDACTEFFSGETEDYEITLLNAITGSNSAQRLKNIAIYPSLSNGVITVDMSQNIENAHLEVIDMTGKKVKQLPLGTAQIQNIDLATLSDGMYFVRINTATELVSHKIVIRK
jgi:hypothetical protein